MAFFLPGVLLTHASTTTACNRLPSLVTLCEADEDEEDEYMDLAMATWTDTDWHEHPTVTKEASSYRCLCGRLAAGERTHKITYRVLHLQCFFVPPLFWHLIVQ